jgi:hypothetical protein
VDGLYLSLFAVSSLLVRLGLYLPFVEVSQCFVFTQQSLPLLTFHERVSIGRIPGVNAVA